MNRVMLGGIAALLVAGAGSWWMMTQEGPATAVASVARTPTPEASAPSVDAPPEDAKAASLDPVAQPDAARAAQSISIERGACFGPCPIYKATVWGDDRLVFEGRKFVAREGTHEAKLAQGSFARLVDIAKRHDFASMDAKWPDEEGLNCPEPPTDMPTVVVTVDAGDLRHRVSYYEGCGGTPAAERVEGMVADLDKALALGEWIGRREDWYGKRSAPDK